MAEPPSPLVTYALRLGDNGLVLGHRLSEWCGRGPTLEEEMALANMGLDLLGQARSLLTYAGEAEGRGRDEDRLAFRRDAGAFRNLLMVELPNGDFAFTILRQLLFAAWAFPLFRELKGSADATLAAVGAKADKEMAYHLRHASEWAIRLGDGTEASHRRAQDALDGLWPYAGEMFEADAVERELVPAGVAVDPATLRPEWDATLDRVLREATLRRPDGGWMQTGGRVGRHTEHMGFLLAEMQFLQRAYPDATW